MADEGRWEVSDEAPKPESFEHGSREARAAAQAMYGEVMHRFFCGLIALHRLRRPWVVPR